MAATSHLMGEPTSLCVMDSPMPPVGAYRRTGSSRSRTHPGDASRLQTAVGGPLLPVGRYTHGGCAIDPAAAFSPTTPPRSPRTASHQLAAASEPTVRARWVQWRGSSSSGATMPSEIEIQRHNAHTHREDARRLQSRRARWVQSPGRAGSAGVTDESLRSPRTPPTSGARTRSRGNGRGDPFEKTLLRASTS